MSRAAGQGLPMRDQLAEMERSSQPSRTAARGASSPATLAGQAPTRVRRRAAAGPRRADPAPPDRPASPPGAAAARRRWHPPARSRPPRARPPGAAGRGAACGSPAARAAGGRWRVQLGAFSSEANARRAWNAVGRPPAGAAAGLRPGRQSDPPPGRARCANRAAADRACAALGSGGAASRSRPEAPPSNTLNRIFAASGLSHRPGLRGKWRAVAHLDGRSSMASPWRRRRMCVLVAGAAAPPRSARSPRPAPSSRPASVPPRRPGRASPPRSRHDRRPGPRAGRGRHRHRLRLRRALGRLRPRRDRRRHEPEVPAAPPSPSRPTPPRIALGVEQGREVVLLDPRVGRGGRRGLGAIGDTEPGRLKHRNVVGAVADGQGLGRDSSPRAGDGVEHGVLLALGADDRLRDGAGRAGPSVTSWLAATGRSRSSSPTGSAKRVKPPETSRVKAPCARIVRTRARARHQPDPFLAAAVDHRLVEPREQGDPRVERRLEVELAAHRLLGDRGHLGLDPGIIGQLVDAFDRDHRRIHVGGEQLLRRRGRRLDDHVGAVDQPLERAPGRFGRSGRTGRSQALPGSTHSLGPGSTPAARSASAAAEISPPLEPILCYQGRNEHIRLEQTAAGAHRRTDRERQVGAGAGAGGRRGGTVINADSAQVYRDLRIVSARPAPRRKRGCRTASTAIATAPTPARRPTGPPTPRPRSPRRRRPGRLPVLVGGTGLYIRTLLEGIAPVPDIDPAGPRRGARLPVAEAPPRSGARIPRRRRGSGRATRRGRRRALEVVRSTGRTLGAWQQAKAGGIGGEVMLAPRPAAAARLALAAATERFEKMISDEGIAEVASLAGAKPAALAPVMRAIGVREIAACLRGELTRGQALEAGRTGDPPICQAPIYLVQPPAAGRMAALPRAARGPAIEAALATSRRGRAAEPPFSPTARPCGSISMPTPTSRLIRGRRVAIIGYGNQGRAQALNLRDSGVAVASRCPRASASRARAAGDGFDVMTAAEAAAQADVVGDARRRRGSGPDLCRGGRAQSPAGRRPRLRPRPQHPLRPDRAAPRPRRLPRRAQGARDGARAATLSRGAADLAVGGGAGRRAVGAEALALSYAGAIGSGRIGILPTSFAEECEADLFNEEAVLWGAIPELIHAGFETLGRGRLLSGRSPISNALPR